MAEPPIGSQGSSPFLLRRVDRAALADDEPSGHSLVHFGPGFAPEPPAAMEQLGGYKEDIIPDETSESLPTNPFGR